MLKIDQNDTSNFLFIWMSNNNFWYWLFSFLTGEIFKVKVMKEFTTPSSTVTAVPVKSAIKSQEQQGTAAPPPSSMPESNAPGIITNENGNNQETEGMLLIFTTYCFWS